MGKPEHLTPRQQAEAVLKTLPTYYTVKDLRDALTLDQLLDAYVQGWLPHLAETALEADPAKLQCWLLARLLRLTLVEHR
jgi:hypothetical protein